MTKKAQDQGVIRTNIDIGIDIDEGKPTNRKVHLVQRNVDEQQQQQVMWL